MTSLDASHANAPSGERGANVPSGENGASNASNPISSRAEGQASDYAQPKAGQRVLSAMSGGVDSSVATLLLHSWGLEVQGVTLKLFNNETSCSLETKTCCSLQDVEDARSVCIDLGVPHYVFNFTKTFGTTVIDKFCDAYLSGETPNPCIDCNRFVKFEALQQRRRDLGFDYVATGHYARRIYNDTTQRFELHTAFDQHKDQSYVLFHLDQDTLRHMLFPLGELTKTQVRELAHKAGFINAQKQESQDICFVPDGNYAAFIHKRTGKSFTPGAIVNREGKRLGTHQGLIHYTIGQRKGIGVAAAQPLYVYEKRPDTNELVVDTDTNTQCRGVIVRDVTYGALDHIDQAQQLSVKTHYRQTAQDAVVTNASNNRLRIEFCAPQRACAPGQFAVCYRADTVVCGGTIEDIIPE